MLHIRLLGTFSVTVNEQPVVGLTRSQLKTVLAFLILRRNTPPTRKDLVKLLWHVEPDHQYKTNLRNLLHHLKQALPVVEEHWALRADPLRWQPKLGSRFDVADFEAVCQRATQCTDSVLQQAALVEAVTLYTGDLWPDCREEWIFPERERLRNLYSSALEQLIALLELQHDYAGALIFAQRLLQANPLREESYRLVMHLYAALADSAGIERSFQECQTQLLRKLNVTPSLLTRELYTRLMQPPSTYHAEPLLPFIERRPEWSELQKRWDHACQGKPQCLLLTGEVGIGKTRLLTEFAASVERYGQAVVVAECHPFSLEVAYAPLIVWLRTALIQRRLKALSSVQRAELAQLLPELQPESAAPAVVSSALAELQRQRFYETLVQLFLADNEPLLLVIDNAHWCDQATIDWLHYLLRSAPTAKVLVVAALSTLELRPHFPVARLWPRLQQSQLVTEMQLKPLTEAGVTTLSRAFIGQPLAPTASAQVYAVTAGNPLYVMEALRLALVSSLILTQGDLLEEALLQSPLIQATLQLYFVSLSTLACDVVGLAAAIGYTFSFDLLTVAALINRETLLLALDELLQRRVVRDLNESAYTFTHHLLQRAAYAALSSAKRRLWQDRVRLAREQLGTG